MSTAAKGEESESGGVAGVLSQLEAKVKIAVKEVRKNNDLFVFGVLGLIYILGMCMTAVVDGWAAPNCLCVLDAARLSDRCFVVSCAGAGVVWCCAVMYCIVLYCGV